MKQSYVQLGSNETEPAVTLAELSARTQERNM